MNIQNNKKGISEKTLMPFLKLTLMFLGVWIQ